MHKTSFLVQKFPETTEDVYTYNLQVPPMSGVARQLRKSISGSKIVETITFSEGCLKSVDHSFKLTIMSSICDDKIDYISIVPTIYPNSSFRKISVSNISISCLRQGAVQNRSELVCNILSDEWISSKGFKWTDDTTEILFEIKVKVDTVGRIEFLAPQKYHEVFKAEYNTTGLDIEKYFLSPDFSDIEIGCGDEKFPAHKFVLACKSTFLSLVQQPVQGSPQLMMVHDVEPEIMKEVLRFVYTGKVQGVEKIVRPLYYAANKYEIDDLKELCEIILVGEINASNAKEMLILAEQYSARILLAKAKSILAVPSPPKRGAPTSSSIRGGKRSRIDGF